jgi:predicted metal-dependent phosphoesterase TrpH
VSKDKRRWQYESSAFHRVYILTRFSINSSRHLFKYNIRKNTIPITITAIASITPNNFKPEATTQWLGDDGPAYVHYEKFSIVEGIDLLRSCGAVPVWAHPYLFRGGVVEEVLKELVDAGLMGIEVYHPSHSSSQIQKLKNLCLQYGLLATGGSDYHGPDPQNKGTESTQLNMLHLPLELLDPIKIAAASLN